MTAHVRANSAVLVHVGVLGALVGAELTRDHARVELRVHEIVWRFRAAQQQSARGRAHIRAVEIGGDAMTQRLDVMGFRETRVSAQRAGFGTSTECDEGFGVILGVLSISARMTAQHGFDFVSHDRRISELESAGSRYAH